VKISGNEAVISEAVVTCQSVSAVSLRVGSSGVGCAIAAPLSIKPPFSPVFFFPYHPPSWRIFGRVGTVC